MLSNVQPKEKALIVLTESDRIPVIYAGWKWLHIGQDRGGGCIWTLRIPDNGENIQKLKQAKWIKLQEESSTLFPF